MNFKSLTKLTFFLPPELLHNLFIQSLKLNLYKVKAENIGWVLLTIMEQKELNYL